MAIQKIKLDGDYIYINDEVKDEEKDVPINNNLDDTIEIEPINEKDLFEDTLTDIFGEENE